MLRWAREHGCDWDFRTTAFAAQGGHLEVLRWAREHSPILGHACIFEYAARGGHLKVLIWAWDWSTCAKAAAGGHMAMLQWARAHDCPWDFRTCAFAAEHGDLELLKWAREHGRALNSFTSELNLSNSRHIHELSWHTRWTEKLKLS